MNRVRRDRFKNQSSQEHRWIISYADFLTLLFAFFAFLFSISSIQNEKFKEVSATLLQLFDVKPSSVDPIELKTTPEGPDIFNPVYKPEPIPGTNVDLDSSQKYSSQSSLMDIQQQIGEQFAQLIEDQLFSVSGDESWIEIEIADSVTFLPGSADITNRAEAILYEVGKLLAATNLPVAVEGYSQLREERVELDGWQLSALRATNVIRYLENSGIAGQRLSAVAFSHHQPVILGSDVGEVGKISIVVAGFEQSIRRP
jgi:chemotaxis protein MotB